MASVFIGFVMDFRTDQLINILWIVRVSELMLDFYLHKKLLEQIIAAIGDLLIQLYTIIGNMLLNAKTVYNMLDI